MKRFLITLIIIASFLSVLSYFSRDKGQLYDVLSSLAVGELAAMEVIEIPALAPQTQFSNRDGEPLGLSDFQGKVVLVNFWATWCAPCLYEMPALNRLQKIMTATVTNDAFEVITMSLDRKGYEVIDQFFVEAGIDALPAYLDNSSKLSLEVGAIGLPTSILLDADGRIIARMVGPMEWDSPQIVEFLMGAVEG